eukprot:5570369-Pyramimonas_sp.AAC.1
MWGWRPRGFKKKCDLVPDPFAGAALERVGYGRMWLTDAVDMASAAQAAGASSTALDLFASWAGRAKCHGR